MHDEQRAAEQLLVGVPVAPELGVEPERLEELELGVEARATCRDTTEMQVRCGGDAGENLSSASRRVPAELRASASIAGMR